MSAAWFRIDVVDLKRGGYGDHACRQQLRAWRAIARLRDARVQEGRAPVERLAGFTLHASSARMAVLRARRSVVMVKVRRPQP